MFTKDFFQNNRTALREQLPENAVVILAAHGQLQRSGDTTFPFRQESNFWYLTGIEEPDCLLVMDQTEEYIVTPTRSRMHEVFSGSVSHEKLHALSGVSVVLNDEEGWQRISAALTRTPRPRVATLPAPSRYLRHDGIYTNPARSRLMQRLRARYRSFELIDIRQALVSLRTTKQPEELAALRETIKITSDAFNALTEQDLTQYKYEYEIEAELTHAYKKNNAVHGYEPIVASGMNATTLHYVKNDGAVQRGELLLIDSGAELNNYSADITRTYSVGSATARQRSVYYAVAEAQAHVLEKVRPGVSLRELEEAACRFIGARLKQLNLITSSADMASVREYYPHAIGHFLGLDVHDVGQHDVRLQPGMVLTVEPGIYIPEEELGVRIEDNICVTANGHELLSGSCRQQL